jgi:hypothetical protein
MPCSVSCLALRSRELGCMITSSRVRELRISWEGWTRLASLMSSTDSPPPHASRTTRRCNLDCSCSWRRCVRQYSSYTTEAGVNGWAVDDSAWLGAQYASAREGKVGPRQTGREARGACGSIGSRPLWMPNLEVLAFAWPTQQMLGGQQQVVGVRTHSKRERSQQFSVHVAVAVFIRAHIGLKPGGTRRRAVGGCGRGHDSAISCESGGKQGWWCLVSVGHD